MTQALCDFGHMSHCYQWISIFTTLRTHCVVFRILHGNRESWIPKCIHDTSIHRTMHNNQQKEEIAREREREEWCNKINA